MLILKMFDVQKCFNINCSHLVIIYITTIKQTKKQNGALDDINDMIHIKDIL